MIGSESFVCYYLLVVCNVVNHIIIMFLQLPTAPLHLAASYDHCDIVHLLLEEGADINDKSDWVSSV